MPRARSAVHAVLMPPPPQGLQRLEFWPDYGRGPLWNGDGQPVDGDALGLPADLSARLLGFNADYEETRLPTDGGAGDWAYLARGRQLLDDVRTAVADRAEVHATEPWWNADT